MRLSVGVAMLGAVCATWPAVAQAQAGSLAATAERVHAAPEELLEVRLRYGVAWRSGTQRDETGPGLGYEGLTPNDPGLQLWVWPLFGGVLGFTGGAAREGFALFDPGTNARVTGGGLLRAHAAATGRLRFGKIRLEPIVGYALNQVAEFGDSSAPALRAGTRHGLLLAARGLVDLGPVTLEARVDYPFPLAATDGSGARASSSGFSAGGGVRVALLRTGTALWGLMLEGAYSTDRITSAIDARQTHVRGGLALDLQWKEEDRAATSGALAVAVVLDADGAPARGARVTVESAGGPSEAPLDEGARGQVEGLLPGPVTARAQLDGYEPAEGSAVIAAGAATALTLRLTKLAPKVGSLLVTVIDKATGAALAGASVTAGGRTATTDARGSARLADLQPGALSVEVSAPGFTARSEAATVLPGLETSVSTTLVSARQRDPATVSGFVRSARGGAPVKANLELPQAGIKARADDKGAFVFRLVGGTYTVTISARGFTTQTKQVTVKDGDQAIFNVDLQPK